MRIATALGLIAFAAGSLTACNGGTPGATENISTTAGTLIETPPFRVASLNSVDLTAQFSASATGQQLLAVALPPGTTQFKCGIDFHYFQYQTLGAKGEQTTASGALMAPTGGTGCTGARPILLYTHGTAFTRSYNIANILDQTNEAWTESALIAAMYAAQGYIVVASNYAGYDISNLPYHPYLNADQQSKDVIYSLDAARTALKAGLPSGVSDNGRLFITGYSQGGHVAMATHKAIQAACTAPPCVTASSPMSGPYAMEALFDSIVFGEVSLGSTVYAPLVIESYQQAYGNIYYLTGTSADVYESTFATGIDTLLPGKLSSSQLVAPGGPLPEFALFNSVATGNASLDGLTTFLTGSSPLFALGFGTPNLLKNSLRVAYANDAFLNPDHALNALTGGSFTDVLPAASPAFALRVALKTNDLRNWTPDGTAPMLLCGGHDDPEVFFSVNAGTMQAYWQPLINTNPFGAAPNNLISVLDVDPGQAVTLGGISAQMGTIAGGVFAADLTANAGAAPATIAADVYTAILANAAFAPYFTAGVANSPQGVLVQGLAGVASQAIPYYMAQGVTTVAQAGTMGTDVGFAITANYHFPFTQIACEVAARAFFAAIP